jgi:hypothetical protein
VRVVVKEGMATKIYTERERESKNYEIADTELVDWF